MQPLQAPGVSSTEEEGGLGGFEPHEMFMEDGLPMSASPRHDEGSDLPGLMRGGKKPKYDVPAFLDPHHNYTVEELKELIQSGRYNAAQVRELKFFMRVVRNRYSAVESQQRRGLMIDDLERGIRDLSLRSSELTSEVDRLHIENRVLMEQLRRMRNIIHNSARKNVDGPPSVFARYASATLSEGASVSPASCESAEAPSCCSPASDSGFPPTFAPPPDEAKRMIVGALIDFLAAHPERMLQFNSLVTDRNSVCCKN